MYLKTSSLLFLYLFVSCIFIFPCGDLSADEVWLEDASAAVKQAKSENKDLLLLFTGSDWCPPCMKLEKEVMSLAEFQEKATEHFVLVKFDFPQQQPQSPELIRQNRQWAQDYGVEGYPTVVLVDVDQKPFAVTGFQGQDVDEYLAMLDEHRNLRINRDAKLKLAEGKEGEERARLLDEAFSEFNEDLVALYYPEIVKEIVALDKDDMLGLRSKWNGAQEAEMRKIVMTDLMMVARLEKPERAIAAIDEEIGKHKFSAKQLLEIHQIKLNLARQLDDPQKVDSVLDAMLQMKGITTETKERLLVKKILLMFGSGRQADAMQLLEASLSDNQEQLHLLKVKGELLVSQGKLKDAVLTYETAMTAAKHEPDILIDLVSAKADALFESEMHAEALQTLDNFSDDTNMPADLRSEALLHKSMLMREMGRERQSRLAENRAIEVIESVTQRAQMQHVVQIMREKYQN